MVIENDGHPVFILENYYDSMPSVQFYATKESIWSFFTGNSISEKEKNKFWKNFKNIKIEYQDEMFSDAVTYKGYYKAQLQTLHEALLKAAEAKGVPVKFKWAFK